MFRFGFVGVVVLLVVRVVVWGIVGGGLGLDFGMRLVVAISCVVGLVLCLSRVGCVGGFVVGLILLAFSLARWAFALV